MGLDSHDIEVGVFAVLLGVMTVAGFAAARWRRPAGSIHAAGTFESGRTPRFRGTEPIGRGASRHAPFISGDARLTP